MDTLILASSSPRRKELLETMGIPFKIHPANCDETIPEGTKAEDASKIIAERKVLSLLERLSEPENKQFILGADTTVIFSGKIYGKPKSKEEAKSFLRSFQGRKQKVVTGVALFDPRSGSVESASVSTFVEFKSMSEEDLERCMNAEEWKDAAGGYKIQGFSACFIKKIDGSYNNVVGLPIEVVYDMLVKHRFEF